MKPIDRQRVVLKKQKSGPNEKKLKAKTVLLRKCNGTGQESVKSEF